MTRRILLIATATFSLLASFAQTTEEVAIKDFTLELKEDGLLNLDIDIDLTKLNLNATQVVVLTPCIINEADTFKFKSIGVYSRNRRIFYQRNEQEKPTGASDINLKASETRDVIDYNASTKYMDWMDGCKLELIRTDYRCCGQSALIGQTELADRFPRESYSPELIYLRPQHEVVKTREIKGSAYIDFPVSKIVINPTYRNNTVELAKIIGTIDSVKNDQDITIKSIFIKGYASPESPYSNNTYLAKGRTEALKEYVESLYHFGEGFIKTDYEPEDWAGLERYVMASSLQHKEEILAAIRSNREPDNKEWFIKSNWKEDYRYLLENCYPALRHSDYVIEYEIRSYASPVEIERILHSAPQNLSLEEFYILAQTYEPGSEKFNELFEIAVRMYPNDPVANLNAANTAMLRGDYRTALLRLERAKSLAESIYTCGALEVYMNNLDEAKQFFENAKAMGISQAERALIEVAKNRNVYKMTRNN